MAGDVQDVTHLDKAVGHEGDCQAVEDQGGDSGERGDGGTETAAAGENTAEESGDGEDEADEEEDPAEPPDVEVVLARSTIAVLADELGGSTASTSTPSPTDGRIGPGTAAVAVAGPADVEIGPLGDGLGTFDARRVCREEVGVVEGGDVGGAGEEDEKRHDDGPSQEDHRDDGRIRTAGHCGRI